MFVVPPELPAWLQGVSLGGGVLLVQQRCCMVLTGGRRGVQVAEKCCVSPFPLAGRGRRPAGGEQQKLLMTRARSSPATLAPTQEHPRASFWDVCPRDPTNRARTATRGCPGMPWVVRRLRPVCVPAFPCHTAGTDVRLGGVTQGPHQVVHRCVAPAACVVLQLRCRMQA